VYSPHLIEIGDNVRIDDFCILSPSTLLKIGSYVHIATYTSIIGKGKIILEDFTSISGRVSIYSSSDDYTGLGMTNPLIPIKYRRVTDGDVIIKRHSIVGAGTVILPNTILEEGVSVGALSLICGNYDEFNVYSGVPAKKINKRHKQFLKYEKFVRNN
jgi:galactoside O-acetyltransferase